MDTKDGVEGIWEGRRVGAEEVRGLEGLVQSIGRGRDKTDDAGAGAEEEGEAMDTS